MKHNFSQRLEMQIPQENAYTGMKIMKNFDEKFEELSKNYSLHNVKQLKTFIKKHENILDFIHGITPLINKYFPNYKKSIEFCEDPEFNDLDFVMIYINCSIYEKDRKTLEKFKNEPLYMSKFSKKINGLVCVGLW